MQNHPGRNLRDMKEHDVFLLIYTSVGILRQIEEKRFDNDGVLINITQNINLGIVLLNFPDTAILDSGEVIPGEEYYSWYKRWFDWVSNLQIEVYEEFDKKYLAGEDISCYLPDWYNLDEAMPLVKEKYEKV